eukprot:gene202-35_t
MATARPVATVFKAENPAEKAKGTVGLPQVFSAPLRADIVRLVHTGMNKNRRQAMAVKDEAGYDTAAISWGTGRAVARIPRVPGGGTHRSGQGAFGNMCRGGGMFNPTKTWRRWHRKVNTTMKRHALAAAISATGVPALVMARGHQIDEVSEIPCIVSNAAESMNKTKDAVQMLERLGAKSELKKVIGSKKIRAGKGKLRNRRYVMRKGPLVVYAKDEGISRAFRNIPGVDVCSVERLNLLQLAPGGTFGRFVVWTEGAIKRLAKVFGTANAGSSEKKGYTLPRSLMTNTDIARIINSNEVQSALLPQKEQSNKRLRQRKNPLKNKAVLGRLCPYANTLKKLGKLAHTKGSAVQKANAKKHSKTVAAKKAHVGAKRSFFKDLEAAYAPKAVAAAEE